MHLLAFARLDAIAAHLYLLVDARQELQRAVLQTPHAVEPSASSSVNSDTGSPSATR